MRPPAPAAQPIHTLLRDLALLLARIFAGGAILHFHGWQEVLAGWNHFFGPKKSWALAGKIEAAGLAHGLPWAVGFSLLAFVASWALITGLLTRLAALGLLALSAALFLLGGNDALRELAVVYAAVFVALFFAGPGRIALDAFFTRKKPAVPLRR